MDVFIAGACTIVMTIKYIHFFLLSNQSNFPNITEKKKIGRKIKRI